MDVRSMLFENETFDCVIDKGTLDTVLVRASLRKRIKFN